MARYRCRSYITKAEAEVLFPGKPEGYHDAAQQLLCYAWDLYMVGHCEKNGRAGQVPYWRGLAEACAAKLPDYAKEYIQ